jgi:hypothetical protein
MTDYRLRTPQEWAEDQGVEILDPEGWRAADVPLDLPITVQEFWRYIGSSTARQRGLLRDRVDPPRLLDGNPPRHRLDVDPEFADRWWAGDGEHERERDDEPRTGVTNASPGAGEVPGHPPRRHGVPSPASSTESDRTVAAAGS